VIGPLPRDAGASWRDRRSGRRECAESRRSRHARRIMLSGRGCRRPVSSKSLVPFRAFGRLSGPMRSTGTARGFWNRRRQRGATVRAVIGL